MFMNLGLERSMWRRSEEKTIPVKEALVSLKITNEPD
jgi:hypothetical protein